MLLVANASNVSQYGFDEGTLKSFKVLRSIKALRLLRAISKNDRLKLAVGSLFEAIPAISNGMIVCFLIVYIYAIIGVSFFKGQFFQCTYIDKGLEIHEQLILETTNKEDCLRNGGTWF